MKPTLNEEIDEYIRPGEKGIYAKDEKGEYFLLRKERFVKDPCLEPKTSKFPKIIFTFMVISIALWIIAIIKISEL